VTVGGEWARWSVDARGALVIARPEEAATIRALASACGGALTASQTSVASYGWRGGGGGGGAAAAADNTTAAVSSSCGFVLTLASLGGRQTLALYGGTEDAATTAINVTATVRGGGAASVVVAGAAPLHGRSGASDALVHVTWTAAEGTAVEVTWTPSAAGGVAAARAVSLHAAAVSAGGMPELPGY
jgi:hypothetical protein